MAIFDPPSPHVILCRILLRSPSPMSQMTKGTKFHGEKKVRGVFDTYYHITFSQSFSLTYFVWPLIDSSPLSTFLYFAEQARQT